MKLNKEDLENIEIDIDARELLKKLRAKGLKLKLSVENRSLILDESKDTKKPSLESKLETAIDHTEETFEEFQKRTQELRSNTNTVYTVEEWLDIVNDL